MQTTLQYFDGCPNWKATDAHLREFRAEGRIGADVEYQLIDTIEAAEQHQFHGSPTVLIDGVDPFAAEDAPVGLACRVYQTENGLAGSPSRRLLEEAIQRAQQGG